MRLITLLSLFPSLSFAAVVGSYSGTPQTQPTAGSGFEQVTESDLAPTPDALLTTSSAQEAPAPSSTKKAKTSSSRKTQKKKNDPAQDKRDAAFNLLLEEALPLSPDQIKTLRKLYDISQQATATTPKAPPTPVSSSTVVNLDPGSTPPVIRLSAGFVTSLVFVDATGAAWPLTAYDVGDPQTFNIQWDQTGNALFVQSLKVYAHGNLAVRLKGLNTPVMISLVSGQKEVDFRVDLQVKGRGPKASAPIVPTSLQVAKVNPILINILDGVPPKGSTKLNVSGNEGQAWLKDDVLYFRTRLTVLSPAWSGTVSSPDGMHVYQMMNTPVILASKDGKTVDIRLSGL